MYLCDTGIGNALSRRETPFEDREDRGPLLEAWVGGTRVRWRRPDAMIEAGGWIEGVE